MIKVILSKCESLCKNNFHMHRFECDIEVKNKETLITKLSFLQCLYCAY